MPATILFKRGTSAQVNAYSGTDGEVVIDKTNKTLRVFDGASTGGSRLATLAELEALTTQVGALAISGVDGLQEALDSKTDKTTTLTAGNGLTGGGDLSSDRTITLGTPEEIGDATANAVSATGHTHALNITKAKVGLANVDNTSDADKPVSTATQAALNLKVDAALLGVADGVATLDSGGKVPLSQLSDTIVGQVEYMGTWDAATNTPTLPTEPTAKGHYYICTTDGTFAGIAFTTGDWIISEGDNPYNWSKVDNTDAVMSVNGYLGNVVLGQGDIGLGQVDNTSDLNKPISTATQTALNSKVDIVVGKALSTNDFTDPLLSKLNGIEAGAQVNVVLSVAGKTGAVTLAKADVSLASVQDYPMASTAEAQAGTATNRYVAPANVVECIQAGNYVIDCGTF